MTGQQGTADTTDRRRRWPHRPVGQDLFGVLRLELFVVSAITAILITRGYLELTGYPQLGGGGLHIAHTLWGTLLLLCAQLLLLGFLQPAMKDLGAVLGGLGFGLTIDEVGKFVTSDNDYFFRPTFAIIYAVFVLIVLGLHWLSEHDPDDPTTLLANAVDLAEAGLFGRMTARRRAEALRLAERAAARGANEQAVRATIELIEACRPAEPGAGRYFRIRRAVGRTARRVARSRAALVIAYLLLLLMAVDAAARGLPDLVQSLDGGEQAIARTIQLGCGVLMALLILVGMAWRFRDHAGGLRVLRYAVLLNLLLGQVFNLAHRQLAGLAGVMISLGLLAILTQALKAETEPDAPGP